MTAAAGACLTASAAPANLRTMSSLATRSYSYTYYYATRATGRGSGHLRA